MIEKILVPIDSIEHDHTYRAVKKAIELTCDLRNKPILTLLHVEYVETDLPKEERKRLVKAKKDEIEEEFNIVETECRKEDISNIETVVREGKPSEEIIKLGEEGDFDLIIMGSGKLHNGSFGGKMKKMVFGSVAEKVIHNSSCSVLIASRNVDGN